MDRQEWLAYDAASLPLDKLEKILKILKWTTEE